MDYTFSNTPIPKHLQVFNSSLYTDIVNRGQKGNQGFTGNGFQGLQGIDGTIGTDGNQGVQGVQGLQGLQGNQGIQGLQGFQGLQGIQGIQGLQGVQGLQGLASSISVNNFVSGIQGLQSSFYYSGAQTVRTDLLRANTIQTDTITNSGTTFKFNASQTANFDGQGIYMSMTTGSVPTVWLRSSTATNKVIAFGDNTGSIPSASIQNFTASSDLRFYTGGNNEMCRMGSASNTTFFYPLIGTQASFTNNYGVGFQGTQGSFGYLGCQSLQGQFLNSSSRIGVQSTSTLPSYTLDVVGANSSTNHARFNNRIPSSTFVSWTEPEGISLFKHQPTTTTSAENYMRMVSGTQGYSGIEFNTTATRDGSILYKHDIPATNRYMTVATNTVDRLRVDASGLLSYSGVQGLQGSFNETLYAKNNYGVGFQGQQGSFNYLGCQSLQAQNIQINSSFVPSVPNSSVQMRYGVASATALTSITISYGYTFTATPLVFVQLDDALNVGSIPANQTQNVSTTQFSVVFNSTTSNLATLRWFAIGQGSS